MNINNLATQFIDACETGKIETAKHLIFTNPNISTVKIQTFTEVFLAREYAFIVACAFGNLRIAQWLYTIFEKKYTIHVNLSACNNACQNNQYVIVKWLVSLDNTVFINNADAFRRACFNGNSIIIEIFRKANPFKYGCKPSKCVVNTNTKISVLSLLYVFCKKGYTNTLFPSIVCMLT